MASLVVLYLRSDVSWGRLTEETYVEQEKYSTAVIPISRNRKEELLQHIKMWNQCFSLSYFEYRQKLKDIADWARAQITHVDLIVKNHQKLEILDQLEDAVIIPTDDDDWFAPVIARTIRDSLAAQADLISWNDAVFCPMRTNRQSGIRSARLAPRKPHPNHFWTNGYAITSRGLKRCPPRFRVQVLGRHSTTLNTFQSHVPNLQSQHIPQSLALTVKSPASFTVLKNLGSLEALRACAPQLLEQSMHVPHGFGWAESLIYQVDELNGQLANSMRIRSAKSDDVETFVPSVRKVGEWLTPPITRTSVINAIGRRFGYQTYLEIGCGQCRNFDQVNMSVKTGVDPRGRGTHHMTSDEFFRTNSCRFDLIFIDGLHKEKQVLRDFESALVALNEGGCILIHDCLPEDERQQSFPRTVSGWVGDVWKAIAQIRFRPDVDTAVLDRCRGMAAVLKRNNSNPLNALPELSWGTYLSYRNELMRVLHPADFERFLSETVNTCRGRRW